MATALALLNPIPAFQDLDGSPLDDGYLYFGTANQNPITSPVTVYWDAAATIPAAQPIRTINGFPWRNGSPAIIYTSGNVSMLVRNRNGAQVLNARTSADFGTAATVAAQLDRLASTASASDGAGMVGFNPALDYDDETVGGELSQRINVRALGALADGSDDLAALEAARAVAGARGKTLYFPLGEYCVSDIFYFALDGCTSVYFEPGATIKLLASSTVGGCTAAWDGVASVTEPLEVHNLTVDCNSIAGENGVGLTHPVRSKFVNLTVKNVLHHSVTFGGKAVQWEGAETTASSVHGLTVEDSTVGIDIGAVDAVQSTHLTIYNAAMKNVDIPVHVNDTNTSTPSGSVDQMEVLVDGLHCRNCGKLTYSGATATGGGIIVTDRGFGLTVRNVKVVNDRGGYGSTAYGTIGAFVRGQGLGINFEGYEIDADMVAFIDHNPAGFQSPFAGDIASYVRSLGGGRHYGNLDYIIKCLPGGGKMGSGIVRGLEIGSTLATLAGIVDANAAAYSSAHLEVIDRDNLNLSSGLRSLFELNAFGNALNGNTQGLHAPAQMAGSWTPVDGSAAGLVLTSAQGWWVRMGELVIAMGTATYPATANGADAVIGGLPFTVRNQQYARYGSTLTVSSVAAAQKIGPTANTTTAGILSGTSAAVTNAQCTGGTFGFLLIYVV
jgi:hypothetical protein